jgi:hypothetical protein
MTFVVQVGDVTSQVDMREVAFQLQRAGITKGRSP